MHRLCVYKTTATQTYPKLTYPRAILLDTQSIRNRRGVLECAPLSSSISTSTLHAPPSICTKIVVESSLKCFPSALSKAKLPGSWTGLCVCAKMTPGQLHVRRVLPNISNPIKHTMICPSLCFENLNSSWHIQIPSPSLSVISQACVQPMTYTAVCGRWIGNPAPLPLILRR